LREGWKLWPYSVRSRCYSHLASPLVGLVVFFTARATSHSTWAGDVADASALFTLNYCRHAEYALGVKAACASCLATGFLAFFVCFGAGGWLGWPDAVIIW
jgi:hypothetical protein